MAGIGGVRRLQFCFDLLLTLWCTSALLADVQTDWSDQKRQAIASLQAGDFSKAEKLLNSALAALPNAESSEAVLLWNQLGLTYEADNLRLTEAKQAFRHALDINEQKEVRSNVEEAISLNNLGTAFQLADDLKTAEKLFRQADSVLIQYDLLQTSTAGPVLSNLALVLQQQGRFAESEITFEHAVAVFHRSNTEDTLEFARCVTNFGRLKYETGHFQEALTKQERALSLEGALPSNAVNAGDRAYVLCNLGMARGQLGMLSAARESLLKSIELETSNQAAPDPRLPETLNDLATIENNMGNLSLAKEHGQQALAFADRLRSSDDPIRAAIWTNLGTMATKEHDYKYARQLYDQAAELWLKTVGPRRPEYAATLFNIATLEAKEGRRKQAKEIFLRCLQIDLSWFGPRHPQVATDLANIAAELFFQKKYQQAIGMYDRARQIDEASLGPQTGESASIWRNLGIVYQKSKRYADAQFAYGHAIQIYTLSPTTSAQLFSCLRADADVLRKLDRFSEAEQADVQASKIQVRTAIEAEKKTTIAAAAFADKN